MNKKTVKRKKVTKKVVQPKKPTLMDRLPKNHGEWLELVIRLTERAIKDGRPDYMVAQKQRLMAELEAWKSQNK